MPELPEVETIRRDLQQDLLGYSFVKITTTVPQRVFPSAESITEVLYGSSITGFQRVGKLLIIVFKPSKLYLLVHLKMSGRLFIRKIGDPQDSHVRTVIHLKKGNDQKELRFSDARKFGFLKLVDDTQLQQILKKYGPEPLADLTLEKFAVIVKKTGRPIKTVLLDQSLISGIGNIYANEALFLAKIHPVRPARNLLSREIKKLLGMIELVLQQGIEARGTSDNTYRDAYGQKGNYQSQLRVYKKAGQKCPNCGTEIVRISLGQRGTFFCPSCQKNNK